MSSGGVHILALLLAGSVVFLPNLGQELHVDGREARHAEISRAMVETGDYLVPSVFGRPYIDKPPLYNWCAAALFRLTGRVTFALARLPSAVAAIAAALGIYVLGRRWFSPRAGIVASIVWMTSWLVIEWGRLSRMDMMFATLVLYALVLADIAARARAGWRRSMVCLGSAALVGAATMSKGPLALFFFAVGLVGIWRARRGRWIPSPFLLSGAILASLAALGGWLWLAERGHPGHFRALFDYQFGQGFVEHPKRQFLYFDQLLLRTAPWGIFAAGASRWVFRDWRRNGFTCETVPAFVLIVCLVVMTIVQNKRAHYILPALPMWALFLGGFIDRAVARRTQSAPAGEGTPADPPAWGFDWPLRVALIGLSIVGLLSPFAWWTFARGGRLAGTAVSVTVAVVAGVGAAFAWRGKASRAFLMFIVALVVGFASVYPLVLPHFYRASPDGAAVASIARAVPAGLPVADYGVRNEYLSFKLNRHIVYVGTIEDLIRFLAAQPRCCVLIPTDRVPALVEKAARPVRVLCTCRLDKDEVSVVLSDPEAESRAQDG